MRRGVTNNEEKIKKETSSNFDRPTLDLLKLRLITTPEKYKKNLEHEAGSGDNLFIDKNASKHHFRHSLHKIHLQEPGPERIYQGYGNTKAPVRKFEVSTQTRLDYSHVVDDFLLPPNKKNSKEFCALRSKSKYSLSSAGDAGNFPFKLTPSGNLKVRSQQVVFESKKLSVLVANPERTEVKVYSENFSEANVGKKMAYRTAEFSKNSAMETILNQAGFSGLDSIMGDTPVRNAYKVSSEYESKQTSEILNPELNLRRLGYSGNEPIDWNKVALPDKKNLYLELRKRINSKKNADTKVHIGKEEFTCHLMVLQCYSELFDSYVAIKKVEIPPDKCSAASFAFIYDWMVSEEQCHKHLNRENVLDILNSAKYLKIKDLVEQCWAFVDDIEIFNEETAFLLYKDAKLKKVEEVRELMVPRIQDFFLILVSSQDWLVLEFEDVKNLLCSNYIRINCEMEVFMSAVRWLKYDWTHRDKFKYEVLNCVRFGNIAPWQLVDIKRNPENLEFMDLAKDPAICKLIDDGLAYVIIKYWYAQENEDFQHWNSVLGLQEPPPRNWSGLDKTYFSYREFLIYLDKYRRHKLIEKSKPKAISDKKTTGSVSVMVEDPISSTGDFLTKKKAGISGLGSIIGDTPVRSAYKVSSEYDSKQTKEILDPELNLSRLGYSGNEPIDWNKVSLPEKKNLYSELRTRINSKKNADTKVHIGKEEFSCHLIVLQCYSELFDGYVAIKKIEIPPDKCGAASFAFIYDWMVNEEQCFKHLNRQNVLDILNSAKYLKIKDLVEQCWAFVDDTEIFNEETAFLLYVDAKTKKVEEVRDLMVPRIQDFFLTLVSSQDWLVLEVEDVKNLLSSNYIRINCEMEVFMSAVRWLKYDTHRNKFKYEVLNCVRFGNIAPWQLVDIKRNPENLEFMDLAKDPAICKLIDDGLAFVIIKYWYGQENEDFQHWNSVLGLQEPPPRNWTGLDKTYFTYKEFLIYLDQYRRNKLMEKSKPKAISDKKTTGSSTVMLEEPPPSMEDFLTKKKDEYLDEDEEEEIKNVRRLFTHDENRNAYKTLNRLSKTLLSPPNKKLLGENSLFLRNRETILVFGGVDPFAPLGFRKNTGKSIFRYLPDHNSWEYVGDMPEPRHYHSIAFMKGRIYLAGGTDPRDNEIRGNARVMDTVWSFDPSQRSWFSEKSLGKRRRNFELVACQEKMYAIGGCDDQFIAMNSVERFDPKLNIWDTVAPMQFARAALACTKYRNTIWVAGGTPDMKKNLLLDVVESYDVKYNQWTRIRRVLSPRCFSRVIVMSDKLYLIGGIGHRLKQLGTLTSLATIDLWDKRTMSWKTIMDLTIPRHGHTVAYVGTQIFVLGGVTTIYTRCLNNTECFCTHRGVWVRGISYLPVPVSGHATITVPPASLLVE